jgi:hypothetical protein
LALSVPLSRFTPRVGGGSAFYVRGAMARFNQVGGVTDSERDLAFSNIKKAANHFDIQMKEADWRQFGTQRA